MNAPSLLDVGGTKLKDTSPTVFVGTEKLDRPGVPSSTVKVAVMVPDE